MAGANFPRIKTWVSSEDVVYSDLNAEFDNILNNLTAANVDDYSANVSQMQSVTDPGEVGTESLATSVAGEIQRIRNVIKEITGKSYWYESPVASLLGLSNAVGTGLTNNRLVSGRVATSNAQPMFLVPNGAAKTVTAKGTTTNLHYYINGTEYVILTDTNLTGLTAAPSTNNTCLVNDGIAAAQDYTKYLGEDGTDIIVDTMGSNISALVGTFAGFKIGAEYFIAYVTSTTSLTKCRRGYFFDSTDAALPRVTYSDNATITLMKLTWVFAKTDLTLTATYNNPVWADDEPSSPSLGDYWFDFSTNKWKVYGVGSYADANATLIGICLQDTTNTVAARSFEFFGNYSADNTCELMFESNSQVKSRYPGAQVNVYGTFINNNQNLHTWDMTLDLDSGVTEGASTYYYFYLTETGDKIISNIRPYDRREDLGGFYHTHKSWRCVGYAFNNASQNLIEVESYFRRYTSQAVRSISATGNVTEHDDFMLLSGASYVEYLPSAAFYKGKVLTFKHNGTSLTQVYTLDGYGAETINGSATYLLYTANEVVRIISDGTNWHVVEHFSNTDWVAYTPTFTGFGTVSVQAFYWRRSGTDVIVHGRFTVGTSTGTEARLSLPATSVSTITTLEGCGTLYKDTGAGATVFSFACLIEPSVAYITFGNNTSGAQSLNKKLGTDFSGAGVVLALQVIVPITGWNP